MKRLVIIITSVAIILTFILLGWRSFRGTDNQINYQFAKVENGDIVQTVNATGIVQPLQTVQVGTQVTGVVKKLYANFNSRVKKDEIVAQIDPAIYKAQVNQNKANLVRSEAEVKRVKVNLILAEKELARSQELANRDLVSQSDLDNAIANRDSLIAQLESAEATVEQSKSTLETAQVNLGYTTIKSPVDGIVISRNVDEGQTVVANMSVQNIFVIATDLKKMQIEANVPEADIGKIRVGQPVTFTVDAYPDIEFSGKVAEIRLSPTTVSNVVTYTVIIETANLGEKLFPGMTANLTCQVNHLEKILKIPNAALRFSPDTALISNESMVNQTGQQTQVWIRTDAGLLKAIPVMSGITDGAFTEIVSGDLSEGQEIVMGIMEKGETQTMVNPFGPPRLPGTQKTTK